MKAPLVWVGKEREEGAVERGEKSEFGPGRGGGGGSARVVVYVVE